MTDSRHRELRILMLTPTARDAAIAGDIFLRAGLSSENCSTLDGLLRAMETGVGALLLSEETVLREESMGLREWLQRQPAWSDLPVLLLARPGADSPAVTEAIAELGNVTVLERPVRVASLVSVARTALRARQRQYQIREHLAERARDAADLRVSDRRKDEFLAILAHELRNPLAPIRNSLYVLRNSTQGKDGLGDISEMLERQVHHLVRLVDDLLEVSRINQGKIELRRETVNLATVLQTAVEASHPLIQSRDHSLSLSLPPRQIMLEADPVRLAQVLENLLNNAAKYTPPGGRIEVIVSTEESEVRVTVRDNGVGMAPATIARAFDMFAQAEQSTPRAEGGLGIGLTLVKRLMEMHGGRVEAASEGLGKGSVFRIALPFAPDLYDQPVIQRVATAPSVASRVMVVDDNRDAADTLGMLLRSLGCEVEVLYNGSDALERLPTYRPKAVLLDIGMPEMDGHEVARRIRRLPGGDGLTLIALTGWGQEQDLHRTQEAGFDHHLTKPAEVSALESLLFSR